MDPGPLLKNPSCSRTMTRLDFVFRRRKRHEAPDWFQQWGRSRSFVFLKLNMESGNCEMYEHVELTQGPRALFRKRVVTATPGKSCWYWFFTSNNGSKSARPEESIWHRRILKKKAALVWDARGISAASAYGRDRYISLEFEEDARTALTHSSSKVLARQHVYDSHDVKFPSNESNLLRLTSHAKKPCSRPTGGRSADTPLAVTLGAQDGQGPRLTG